MTVSTAYAPLSFNGNDATTAFAVSWPFFTGSLIVTEIDATGVETVKTLTTHYTVSGGTDSDGLPATGTVTMLTAPATGTQLRVTRSTTKTQASSWTNGGSFQAKTLEAALDKTLLIAQENVPAAYDDITGDSLQLNSSGATDYWDAEDHKIRNVVDGTEDDDAATVAQLNEATLGSLTAASLSEYLALTENASPGTPSANVARLHAKDDGSGNTVLAYMDSTATDNTLAAYGATFNEAAQDAVGGMVDASLVYTDGTPALSRAALTGDVTASAGSNATTLGITTTRGDIIRRGASANERLALGTSGYALLSDGTDAAWAGFTQAGTGAVTRTWQAKLRESINVADFGATGDGATDDTTAIQNAINAAAASNGYVDFFDGVFCVTATLTCGNGTDSVGSTINGIVLRGVGSSPNFGSVYGTVLKWTGADNGGPVVSFNGTADSMGLEDIQIDCNSLAGGGVLMYSLRNSTFTDFSIRNFKEYGLSMQIRIGPGGSVLYASNNLFQRFSITTTATTGNYYGIVIQGQFANGDDWHNCTFTQGTVQVPKSSTGTSYAAYLEFTDSNTWTEVDLDVTGAGTGYGLGLIGAANTSYPENNFFYGCSIYDVNVVEDADVIGDNFFYNFTTKDGETVPSHSKLHGITDTGIMFGRITRQGEVDIASATTCDLATASSPRVRITGTTTITSFGSTGRSGEWVVGRFEGALTLTHSGALTLPGSANITTAAGDRFAALCYGSGDWVVFFFQSAAGYQPLDADLSAVAALGATGIAVRTASNTWAQRSIEAGTNIASITDGDGVSGNPTINASLTPTGLTSINSGPLAGLRNHLINGCMRLNQRAPATNADDTYALDRWIILTQSNPVAVAQATDVEDGTPYMMRITQSNAAAQRFGVEQIIETANCNHLRGQTVSLSARVRCSASTTLRYAILEWTGTANTVTSDFVLDWTNATFTAGNFFTTTSTTVTATGSTALTADTLATVSLSGTLGSSLNNIAVIFWTDSTQAQNVTLDIGKAQFEVGTAATAFERRPISMEYPLAQRYYEKIGEVDNSLTYTSYAAAGANHDIPYGFLTRKRTTPTCAVVGTWTVSNCGQPSIVFPSPGGMVIRATASALGTFQFTNGTASSQYLTAESEL